MSKIRLIMAREVKTRLRKGSFIISTILLAVIAFITSFIPIILDLVSRGSGSSQEIALVQTATLNGSVNAVTFLSQTLNVEFDDKGNVKPTDPNAKPRYVITTVTPAQVPDLQKRVQDGKLQGILTIKRDAQNQLAFEYYSKDSSSFSSGVTRLRTATSLLATQDRFAQAGINPSQAANLFAPTPFNTVNSTNATTGRNASESTFNYFLVLGLIILLFIVVQIYGTFVAQGVVEEKSSRIMEIMINAATPIQLLTGKVMGIGLVSVIQVGLLVVAGVSGALISPAVRSAVLGSNNGSGGFLIDLSGLTIPSMLYFLVFFVLAYFLYAYLFAAVGSLCSRTEDVQQAITPLVYLLLISYFVAIFGLQSLDAGWVVVLSFIPFFSPILMFARIGMTSVPAWEIILAVGLLVAAVALAAWYAGRVYRAGVLMYGKPPKFLQTLGLVRLNK
jgi:ABC-2 type transport system permease protein